MGTCKVTPIFSSLSFGLSALIVSAALPGLANPEPSGHSPHWTYGGSTNPTQWGQLDESFIQCEIGRDQSPINIVVDQDTEDMPVGISFDYTAVPLSIVNNGHSIQVNYEPGSSIRINGEEYALLQFHFHTPSEHHIGGIASAMELHLVHRNEAGQYAVVGVMMEAGEPHETIANLWDHIPEEGNTNTVANLMVNAADLLPDGMGYFGYSGSLTTPPCSENVLWTILTEPIQVSEEQIAAFEQFYPVNARPIQPTNGRIVEVHE
jgi:carbonic anhydrase